MDSRLKEACRDAFSIMTAMHMQTREILTTHLYMIGLTIVVS